MSCHCLLQLHKLCSASIPILTHYLPLPLHQQQLNKALDLGAGKAEILLIEKNIGFESDKIVRALQSAGPERLKELARKAGGNFAGMVALFSKMAAIKAKG